jgi:hypothetical protein
MNWMKKHYERALLGAFAFALIACSGWIGWLALSFPENFSGRGGSQKPDNTVSPADAKSIDAASALASNPRSWISHEGSLFVSRSYVIRDGQLFDPLEGDVPLHPPITNAWLVKYALDYGNPNIKNEDPDGDRFTNLEEFQAGTDPRDPTKVPAYTTKLRHAGFESVPFYLTFSGDAGDGETFSINTKAGRSRTQFLKVGDMIDGTPYKLVASEKSADLVDIKTANVSETISTRDANYTELMARYKKEYKEAKAKYDQVCGWAWKIYRNLIANQRLTSLEKSKAIEETSSRSKAVPTTELLIDFLKDDYDEKKPKELYDKAYQFAHASYNSNVAEKYQDYIKKHPYSESDKEKYTKDLQKQFEDLFRKNHTPDCQFAYPEEKTANVTVENTETGRKFELLLNKVANDPTLYGEFLYLWNNSKLRIKKNDQFALPPEPDRKYKLIDISEQEAQIEDIKSGQKIRIGKTE